MRLRWEAAVGGRRVAWREADCSREPPQAGGRFSIMQGQKGAAFPDLFAFGSLPSKPAHVEQNVFEARCFIFAIKILCYVLILRFSFDRLSGVFFDASYFAC